MQKILFNDSDTITVPTSSYPPAYTPFTVLVHGLGEIPNGRVFYEPTAGQVMPLHNDSNVSSVFGRYYFTTNVLVVELMNITASPQNVKVYWRVYAN